MQQWRLEDLSHYQWEQQHERHREQPGAGLLFFFIHYCPLKLTVRRDCLYLRAMQKIMTQYEVITGLIIHLKESAAIFWFLDNKTSHLRGRHNPPTSALQIHPYTEYWCHNEPFSQTNSPQKHKPTREHRMCVQRVLILLMAADPLNRNVVLLLPCVGTARSV